MRHDDTCGVDAEVETARTKPSYSRLHPERSLERLLFPLFSKRLPQLAIALSGQTVPGLLLSSSDTYPTPSAATAQPGKGRRPKLVKRPSQTHQTADIITISAVNYEEEQQLHTVDQSNNGKGRPTIGRSRRSFHVLISPSVEKHWPKPCIMVCHESLAQIFAWKRQPFASDGDLQALL